MAPDLLDKLYGYFVTDYLICTSIKLFAMKTIRIASAFFIVCVFAACSGSGKKNTITELQKNKVYVKFPDALKMEPDWQKGNSMVFAWKSDPGDLHPANSKTANAKMILNLIHVYLLLPDQVNQGLAPIAAKSLPQASANQKEFTYELRDDAAWDDGTPITAEDVIFSFKAYKCPLTNNPDKKSTLTNLKTIIPDASNPKKFTIVLEKKYIQAILFVTDFPILSKKFYDPARVLDQYTFEQMADPAFKADQITTLKDWFNNFNDGKYGHDPDFFNGGGPYKVVGWESGHTVILQKKPDHWSFHEKDPNIYLHSYPDKIIFKVMTDDNAIGLECKAQTIDATTWLTTRILIDLQNDSLFNRNYFSAFMDNYNMNYIALNMKPDGVRHKKIFDDVRVRKAVALLTPVDLIIKVIAQGKSTRIPSIVSPLKPEYDSTLKLLPYDVAEASRLLDEAGWKDSDGDNIRDKMIDGERVKMEVEFLFGSQGNTTKDIVTMIAESAYPAGVKIDPVPLERTVVSEKAANHDYDMVFGAWSGNSFPEDYSQVWSTNAWASKGGNFTGFGNAASDALIDSINSTLEDSLRIPMVRRLEKIIYDEQPYIFMYSTYRKTVIHKRWRNAIMTSELPGVILNNLQLVSEGSTALASDVQ